MDKFYKIDRKAIEIILKLWILDLKVFYFYYKNSFYHFYFHLGATFDVVRGIEGVNYTRKENDFDISPVKEIKRTTFLPIKTTLIKGHRFEHHNKPTWCDMCEDFIWGLYTQAVRCQCKWRYCNADDKYNYM